jgi:hypothetical protein
VLAEVKIQKGGKWGISKGKVSKLQPGVQHLVVVLKSDSPVEIDWIRFLD